MFCGNIGASLPAEVCGLPLLSALLRGLVVSVGVAVCAIGIIVTIAPALLGRGITGNLGVAGFRFWTNCGGGEKRGEGQLLPHCIGLMLLA